ncbi:capsular associated protein [Purpureocillium lavendulum]|uniref:Capsular associated protein n=1 Tax=Purpureocillium lavendulum TaxID=1247861 RepID=A0AB34G747_9HYPO|nr:capsular associated protein [Purpureocillium lavendulum]
MAWTICVWYATERLLTLANIITLLIVGVAAKKLEPPGRESEKKWSLAPNAGRQYVAPSPRRRALSFIRGRIHDIRVLPVSMQLLFASLVLRTLLFWYTIRMTQCSCPGIEAFLPIFARMCENVTQHDKVTDVETATAKTIRDRGLPPILATVLSSFSALAWALAAILALSSARVLTGTVCPGETTTFYAQLGMCALDAVIIIIVARSWTHETAVEEPASCHLGTVFVFAGICGIVLAVPSWLTDSGLFLAFRIGLGDLGHLVLDSAFAALGVLCGVSLLRDFSPTTVALLVSEVGLFGFLIPRFNFATPVSQEDATVVAQSSLLAAVFAGVLWRLAVPPSYAEKPYAAGSALKWLFLCHVGAVLLTIVCGTLTPTGSAGQPVFEAVEYLVDSARMTKEAWLSQAGASKSLSSAVAEYKRRYDMAPPPNFDKWYEYATTQGSPIIDDFDQIYQDVLPFWGVEPRVLRARTGHLLQHPTLEMGGMRIQGGKVYQSPHIPGTHRWMAEALERMIEPFAKWLPDMVFAVNLADECRVAVSFEEMQLIKLQARASMSGLSHRAEEHSVGGKVQDDSGTREWASGFPVPTTQTSRPGSLTSTYFTNNIRKQIFYDWLAETCPPGSPARTTHWWDWSTLCTSCLSPHSLPVSIAQSSAATPRSAFILSNATIARDPCHQPDLAYLDGFTLSPAAMVGTRTLFPVFSQARVGGFADVLIPSPWDFADKSAYKADDDLEWNDKKNGLYWRGTGSDGFAAHGTWPGFLRARFVHEAYERHNRLESASSVDFRVNASFVGDLSKCDTGDCALELAAFSRWGNAVSPAGSKESASTESVPMKLPPALPFEENWRFRHLMDMDGAGFSGRFRSFLQSRSLPYRAALFHAWYDERVFAWHDYVPVDVRLGHGFWAVVDYLAGIFDKSGPATSGSAGEGQTTARKIAEQGREWASKALRKEDMQVYLFRLLLEWGRVVNDRRESMIYDDDAETTPP